MLLTTSMALQQSTIPPSVNIEASQVDADPMDADPFAFIDVLSSNSMPSKASQSSLNRHFTHFDEVVACFQKLTLD